MNKKENTKPAFSEQEQALLNLMDEVMNSISSRSAAWDGDENIKKRLLVFGLPPERADAVIAQYHEDTDC